MFSERPVEFDLREIDHALATAWGELPGYRALYYEWERAQWGAGSVQLTSDASAWESLDADWRRALLGALAPLAVGQERASTALVPFVDAAPDEEQQVVLTTHLVDVARHTVFLDRFYAEVAQRDEAEMATRLQNQALRIDGAFNELLTVRFAQASEQVRRDPKDRAAFARGSLCWHLLIEGTLYLSRVRALFVGLSETNLSGLTFGLRRVARDLVRHTALGLRTLRDMTAGDAPLTDALRAEVESLAAPGWDALGGYEWLGHHPGEAQAQRQWAAETLARHLETVGL
ncbi:MAG TPA: hypothetical protein VHJ82_07435 [Actinomycetota bacterium]|nr:hypothetical protein [Actinomycetota bacterium]